MQQPDFRPGLPAPKIDTSPRKVPLLEGKDKILGTYLHFLQVLNNAAQIKRSQFSRLEPQQRKLVDLVLFSTFQDCQRLGPIVERQAREILVVYFPGTTFPSLTKETKRE